MNINNANRKIVTLSLCIGIGLSLIMFVSNWLVLIHQGEELSTSRLFDISFYYFSPLLSWILLTIAAIHHAERRNYSKHYIKANLVWLLAIVVTLSPIVRMFDILVDFAFKNLLGMINISPFRVLNEVWLVVLFSSPTAVFRMAAIIALVYYFKYSKTGSETIALRSSSGGYHQLTKNSICYLQADGNYLNIRIGANNFRTRDTLKSIESKLGADFFRIHKSSIINWKYIKQLKHWRNGEYLIMMNDEKPLTSSKSYKSTIDEIKKLMRNGTESIDDPRSATIRPTIA